MAIAEDVLQGFNANGVRVALTGAVRTAKLGQKLPDIGEKYADAGEFVNIGYISPDGVEISFDEDKQEYTPWQELSPVRTDITKAAKSVKFTLWETGPERIAHFLGVPIDQVKDIADGGKEFFEGGVPTFEHTQLHIDMVDGDKHNRVSFLNAKISERGAMVLKKDEIFGLEVTYTTFPAGFEYDEQLRGKTARWQFNKSYTDAEAGVSTSTDDVAPLSVETASLPEGTKSEMYSAQLSATGGTEPYTWTVSDGTLPTGIELAENGALSGNIDNSATTQEVTFKVVDKNSLPATKQLTITING